MTGTDGRRRNAAAAALLDEEQLRNRFAVAVDGPAAGRSRCPSAPTPEMP